MKQWQQKDLKFLLDPKYFPDCIECGRAFFHKPGCQRGDCKDWSTINKRLNKRLEEFERKYGVNGNMVKCSFCENKAAGTMYIYYHHSTHAIEKLPVCMDHAYYEDASGRETAFFPE